VFGLYISREEISLSDDEVSMFENLKFVKPQTISYFQWTVQCIKHSSRKEIFRYLGLKDEQIGRVSSASSSTEITAPIVYPKEMTGRNDVRIVSFMMSAEDLLEVCYVLRKDNWEESMWLYQRLIDKKKIKNIRLFLESKGVAFYNNVIVALPDNVSLIDVAGDYHTIHDIDSLDNSCRLVLPRRMNSICVIDGQHRIYAHYESGLNNKQERKIAKLRKQLHLLVTGLIFPREMDMEKRARIQSEIFLEINSTVKTVPQSVLMHIKRISNPIADESIAQFVIEELNKKGIFEKLFQVSALDNARIKTASIVRFALRYLVTVTPSKEKPSLFVYWDGDRDSLLEAKGSAVNEYVGFCANVLRNYFGAIRKNMKEQWEDQSSKLLSVISINGFIIALNRQLNINGVHDFDYYDKVFSSWSFDFSRNGFPYTSSQYRKFSGDILEGAFKIVEPND
jgi:DGQHR domain-containing protein